jgi:Dihaem cytochrome c
MTRTSLLPIAAAPALAAALLAAPLAADGPRLVPIKDPVVAKECSACHMLYPAGLLPARSWAAITANLTDHFGDNAELDAATTQRVADYLAANAADSAKGSGKVLRGLGPAAVPTRIT